MSLPVIPPLQWLFGSNEDGEGGEGKKALLMIIQFFHRCVIIGYNIETSCQNKGEVVAGQGGGWERRGLIENIHCCCGSWKRSAWGLLWGWWRDAAFLRASVPLATACPFLEGCVALQTQAAPGLLAEFLGVAERREAQLSACTPQCGVLEADKGKSGMGVGCERFKGKDCWDFNQAKPWASDQKASCSAVRQAGCDLQKWQLPTQAFAPSLCYC